MAARLSDVHNTLPLDRTARFSIHVSFGNVHRVATGLLVAGKRGSAAVTAPNVKRSKTMAVNMTVSWTVVVNV